MIGCEISRLLPSTKSSSPQNPWFNRACFRAIRDKDNGYFELKNYLAITLSIFHSALNRCKNTFRRVKQTFIKGKYAYFRGSSTNKTFVNICNYDWLFVCFVFYCLCSFLLFRSDGTLANTSIYKLIFLTMYYYNFTMDDSGILLLLLLPYSVPCNCLWLYLNRCVRFWNE